MLISGWYEGEYGAQIIAISGADTVEDLADALYTRYGEDCIGVDMELSGEYSDGTDVETNMPQLWDELEFLTAINSVYPIT
tara:strand:- start:100 stop:342 length:243 start_codon:yes stop_codon:yes gene_type:complete